MSNELEYTYMSQVTLEASGDATAAAAYGAAGDAALSSSNHGNYPLGDFVVACAFASSIATGGVVYLFRQDLNIDGTNDAPAPATTYEATLVGTFPMPAAALTTGYYPCVNVALTKECQFSIKNGTDATIAAGWTLKVTPKTYVPGT